MTKIFCPQCAWKPRRRDLWMCVPGCGHEWHTFDTRAQCPQCLKQWEKTQCLRCNANSPHENWYHDEANDLAALDGLLEPSEAEREREKALIGN